MAASHLRSAGTWHRTGTSASRRAGASASHRQLVAELLDDLAAKLALDEVHAGQRVADAALAARRAFAGPWVLRKIVIRLGGLPPPGRLRMAGGLPAACCPCRPPRPGRPGPAEAPA